MELPDVRQEKQTKSICIIGAGPGGLAALKVLMDTPQYKTGSWVPTVFETRDSVGGVWLPAPATDEPPFTPLYDSLTTNIPHTVMAYTSYPFPPSTPVFPRASIVKTYLESYSTHFKLTAHIQFNTSVVNAQWDAKDWVVQLSTGEVFHFDLVIVANGHYRLPRFPDTPGASAWIAAGRASHSAWYRRPHNLGNTVLVVGGGPSGQDISAEMRTVAKTVIHSVTGAENEDIGNLKRRGHVTSFGEHGTATFEDGTVESGIDHCILATGYEFSFPFLPDSVIRKALPPPSPPLPRDLYNSSYHVFPLAKHIFPLQANYPPSSLVFLGLPIRVAPFPIYEAQMRAVIRVFSSPESLDVTREAVDIITRYEELRAANGNSPLNIARGWHRFKDAEQFEYRDQLYDFATAGSDGPEDENLPRVVVPEWEKKMYFKKDTLRRVWVVLEKSGEADAFVKGVGEGGPEEWIGCLDRLLERGEALDAAIGKPEARL